MHRKGGGFVITSTHTKQSAKTRKMKDIEKYGIDVHRKKIYDLHEIRRQFPKYYARWSHPTSRPVIILRLSG